MKKYRVALKFMIKSFDEVEAEIPTFEALNRFMEDNLMLASLFQYKTGNKINVAESSLFGALIIECYDRNEIFRYAFPTYRELCDFLSDHQECAEAIGFPISQVA
jgi:hypothetical protein